MKNNLTNGEQPEEKSSLPIEFIKIPGDKGSAINTGNEEEYLIAQLKNAVSAESLLKEYWYLICNKPTHLYKDEHLAWYKKFETYMKGMPAASHPIKGNEGEWISVEDGLPTGNYGKRVDYLTSDKYGRYNLNPFINGEFKYFDESIDDYRKMYNITHWMPLPSPPKI